MNLMSAYKECLLQVLGGTIEFEGRLVNRLADGLARHATAMGVNDVFSCILRDPLFV